MPHDDPDDRPKAPVRHAIGQDLAALSVHELRERIAVLESERERLVAEIGRKESSREAAQSFFKS